MKKLMQIVLAAAVVTGSAFAFQAAPATATKTATKETKAAPTAPPTDADIAAATKRGDVWLNENTKVYHKSTDKEYGKTKKGAFMSEADAQKAGGHLAKEGAVKSKKTDK
jgi:hypothetical protein